MSVYESSCSSLWTLGWLHHRLRSCWKFPKLLFPLCRLCDLHFPGLSVRFVTGYLLPPRMTNLLLRVLVGNTTSECKGKKDWELWDQAEEQNANETCVNSCLREYVFCKNKSHIICYRKEAIITGDVLLITCKHVQTHMDTHTKVSRTHQSFFSVSWGPPSGSASRNAFAFDWSFWELQMFYFGNSYMNVGLLRKLHDEI